MAKIDIEVTAEQFKELPAEVQGFYTQDGDKYALEGIKGMQTALAKEKERSAAFSGLNPEEAKAALAKANGIDFDIEEAREALKLKSQIEQKQLIEQGDFEKAKEKLQTEFTTQLDSLTQSKTGLLNKFGETALQNAVEAAGVRAEFKDLVATQLLQTEIEIGEKDGDIQFLAKDGTGSVADMDKIIGAMKETRAALFGAEQKPGSGANGNGNGTGAGTKWADLGNNEKVAAITEYGSRDEAMKHYQ